MPSHYDWKLYYYHQSTRSVAKSLKRTFVLLASSLNVDINLHLPLGDVVIDTTHASLRQQEQNSSH